MISRNLERIKLSELPSVLLSQRNLLPEIPAIYIVAGNSGCVLYVGTTVITVGGRATLDKLIPYIQNQQRPTN